MRGKPRSKQLTCARRKKSTRSTEHRHACKGGRTTRGHAVHLRQTAWDHPRRKWQNQLNGGMAAGDVQPWLDVWPDVSYVSKREMRAPKCYARKRPRPTFEHGRTMEGAVELANSTARRQASGSVQTCLNARRISAAQ